MAAAVVSAAPFESLAVRAKKQVPPSDKVVVGVIGCKGMGFSDLRSLLKIGEVECGALCDVDNNVLRERAVEVEEMTSVKPRLYRDYRDYRICWRTVISTPS